jgi:hypothetical protein
LVIPQYGQRIRGHFEEAQRPVVILEKPSTLVVKLAKISIVGVCGRARMQMIFLRLIMQAVF